MNEYHPIEPFFGTYAGMVTTEVSDEDGAVRLSITNQVFSRQDIKDLRKYLKAILRDTKA